MASKEETVKVLNDLIRTSEDGERGFKAAAEKAEDTNLRSLFQDRAMTCHSAATELQSLVRALGGKPADSGSVAGAAHRGWAKARAAVGDNNVAMLEEVERGEDVAKAAYAKALDADLPPDVLQVVDEQYQGVLRNHAKVRDLRNQYRAAKH
jgi:uncharacterized protein (TIGR02284 family)